MYTQLQRFIGTILLVSMFLQSCASPEFRVRVEEETAPSSVQLRSDQPKPEERPAVHRLQAAAPPLVTPVISNQLLPANKGACESLRSTQNNKSSTTAVLRLQTKDCTTYGPFGIAHGKQVTITQATGGWQAALTEQYGPETLLQTLPVYCKAPIPQTLSQLMGMEQHLYKHHIHLLGGSNGAAVYLGDMGLKGGGKGRVEDKCYFPYHVAVEHDPDSNHQGPLRRKALRAEEGWLTFMPGDDGDWLVYAELLQRTFPLRAPFALSLTADDLMDKQIVSPSLWTLAEEIAPCVSIAPTTPESVLASRRRREAEKQKEQEEKARKQKEEEERARKQKEKGLKGGGKGRVEDGCPFPYHVAVALDPHSKLQAPFYRKGAYEAEGWLIFQPGADGDWLVHAEWLELILPLRADFALSMTADDLMDKQIRCPAISLSVEKETPSCVAIMVATPEIILAGRRRREEEARKQKEKMALKGEDSEESKNASRANQLSAEPLSTLLPCQLRSIVYDYVGGLAGLKLTARSKESYEAGALQAYWKALDDCVFDAEKWRKYYGEVGPAPPIPPHIVQLLNQDCKLWPGKKVYATHLLTLIPATVDGEPLNLTRFSKLIQQPRNSEHAARYTTCSNLWFLCMFADRPAPASHWALMTRDVLEGSRNKSYADQQVLVEKKAKTVGIPYALMPILTGVVSTLCHHVVGGEQLFSGTRYTYSRTSEMTPDKDLSPNFGYFFAAGLGLNNSPLDTADYLAVAVVLR